MHRLIVCSLMIATFGAAVASAATTGYTQTNLVSDGAVPAAHIDMDLKNPWGISFGGSSPFWISDNGTGLSTLYNGSGVKQGLVVTVPPAPGSPAGTLGTPTGTVAAGASSFQGDRFIFASEDGVISGWQPSLGTNAAVRVDSSGSGAVYKGLAVLNGDLFATDFAGGKVDVWGTGYAPVSLGAGAFTDPNLPSGYSPFGIQALNDGFLYVTYAKKEAGGNDDVAGPGFGFVDKYDAAGNLIQRLIVGSPGDPNSPLNSPWGLALAPAGFGDASNLLLVGNFGNGKINAFDPATGSFVSSLNDANGHPVVISGLWGLAFGNNGPGFDAKKLYFTAGLNGEEDGLFGSLQPAPEPGTWLCVGAGAIGILLRRKFYRV